MNYKTQLSIISSLSKFSTRQVSSISQLFETCLINFFLSGIATLKVRVPCKTNGTKLLNFKIKLSETAKTFQEMVSTKLDVGSSNVKLIANGKVLDLQQSLSDQGIKNNKQIMALVTESDESSVEDPYARIRKIRAETELLLNSKDSGFLAVRFNFSFS